MKSSYFLGILLLVTAFISGCDKESKVEERRVPKRVSTVEEVEESLGYLGSDADAVGVASLCLDLREAQSAANFPLDLRVRCIAALLEGAEREGLGEWRDLAIEFGATAADLARAMKYKEDWEKEMANSARAMSNMAAAPLSQLIRAYPGPWHNTVNPEISRELSEWEIQECGEYRFRRHARSRDGYLVHCIRGGKDWRAYLVYVGGYGGVTGPYAPTLH